MRTSAQIRREFIDYFVKKCGHTFVPSSPCVPVDDPTLMFTNAGMNQFKPIFLGQQAPDVDKWPGATPGMPTRAVNTQKCIRAGGKHNDLDDVGHDTYHHTFFEMLGNWSFGDYFKAEAIEWAWDLLTNVWGIDPLRLHATYFEGDQSEGLAPDTEARDLWLKILPPERVHPGNKKDNFWEMGDTGPCGPCSEIHIDLTPDRSGGRLVNAGDARVMEIWNLVFIQFNRGQDSKLTPLPAKHVDTGMGFERITSVVQGIESGRLGKLSNYDTDVFTPIFAAIQSVTGAPAYTGLLEDAAGSHVSAAVMKDVAYRVIADHIRTLTFAITDGATPSNEGRGYVLRRILRRAVRYGRQYLGTREPFLCRLVPAVADAMGEAFPELRKSHGGRNVEHVASVLRDEEASFIKTLDRGIALFEECAERTERIAAGDYVTEKSRTDPPTAELYATGKWIHPGEVEIYIDAGNGVIPGELAFKLHDTYGFPIDLTELMAKERDLTVDIGKYERLMEEAREKARGQRKEFENTDLLFDIQTTTSPTIFVGYESTSVADVAITKLLWENDRGQICGGTLQLEEGQRGAVVLNKTSFYAEKGGQVGDRGVIIARDSALFEVIETRDVAGRHLHIGRCKRGKIEFRVFDSATVPAVEVIIPFCEANVETDIRISIMRNHSATHVLNWALRDVLGDHVQQKGSLVDPDKTRFDFSHPSQVTEEELARIEELVNSQIEDDLEIFTAEADQKQAREVNTLRAVFGEKYPDRVRVVSIGVPVDQLLSDPGNDEWMRYSVEFCGGTHVKRTSEIARFRLIEESAVAKGIRRVIGVTGDRARQAEDDATAVARLLKEAGSAQDDAVPQRIAEITSILSQAELPVVEKSRIRADLAHLQERAKRLQKEQSKAGAGEVLSQAEALLASAPRAGTVAIVCGAVPGATSDQLRAACDSLRAKAGSAAVLLASESEGKVVLMAAMTADVVGRGVKAGDLIRDIAPIVGGKGGGRPDMAQGGGPDAGKIGEAVSSAGQWIRQKLG